VSGSTTVIEVIGEDAHDILRAIAVMPLDRARRFPAAESRRLLNFLPPDSPSDAKTWNMEDVLLKTRMDFGAGDLSTKPQECPEMVQFKVDLPGNPPSRHNVSLRLAHENSPFYQSRVPADGSMGCDSLMVVAGSEVGRAYASSTPPPAAAQSAAPPSVAGLRALATPPSGERAPFVYLSDIAIQRVMDHLYWTPRLKSVVIVVPGIEWLFAGRIRPVPEDGAEPFTHLACAQDNWLVLSLLARCVPESSGMHNLLLNLIEWQASAPHLRRLAAIQPTSANGFTFDDGEPNVDRRSGRPMLTPDGLVMGAVRRQGPGPASFPATAAVARRWTPLNGADALSGLLRHEPEQSAFLVQDFVTAIGGSAALAS
jgi:hypothetical protein